MRRIKPDKFSKELSTSPERLLEQLEKRLKISALQMEGRSKQVAFSGFKNRTGRLRQSIAGRFAIIDGMPTAILQAGGQFGGSELEYAKTIEFGGQSNYLGRSIYIKPRLFLGRSIKAQQEILKPRFEKLLLAALGRRS